MEEPLDTSEIGISGMTCHHCARRVEKALRSVDGVKSVTVDRANGRARVTFDRTKTGIAELLDTLRKSGYPPTATSA